MDTLTPIRQRSIPRPAERAVWPHLPDGLLRGKAVGLNPGRKKGKGCAIAKDIL